jgi:hypothetical protein
MGALSPQIGCDIEHFYDQVVEQFTHRLWSDRDRHEGDRLRLFSAVRNAVGGVRVLYPGSFVDVAASAVYPVVTYVDIDNRTPRFFRDTSGISDIIESMGGPPKHVVEFRHADYRDELPIETKSFVLLVSLYAGFVSEHCTRHLSVGGTLLVGPSHGDAAMASIDRRCQLTGVVVSCSGSYNVSTNQIDSYLVPKKPVDITPELLHEKGRGIAYTKSPFGYLFQRIA